MVLMEPESDRLHIIHIVEFHQCNDLSWDIAVDVNIANITTLSCSGKLPCMPNRCNILEGVSHKRHPGMVSKCAPVIK